MAQDTKCWDLIVITTSNCLLTKTLEEECGVLSRGGFLPAHNELMVVTDPHDPTGGGGVGSGGATINAVLIAAETLSAKKGRSMIDSGDLEDSRVLVLHAGRPPQRQWLLNPAHLAPILRTPEEGYPFAMDGAVPAAVKAELPWPASPLVCSVWAATHLARNFNKGLWISSIDSVLLFPHGRTLCCVPECDDAVLFTLPVPASKAVHHGIVITDSQDTVLQLLYQPPLEHCQNMFEGGSVPVISGQLYLPPAVCAHLLTLHTRHPFTHCTYHAADSGLQPFSVSLYFELVAALCATAGGKCCTTAISNAHKYSTLHFGPQGFDMRILARQCAEKTFAGCRMKAYQLDSMEFLHCLSVNSLSDEPFLASWKDETLETRVRSFNSNILDDSHLATREISPERTAKPTCSVDSYKSEGIVVECGEGSLILGLLLEGSGVVHLGSNLVWQQCCIKATGGAESAGENIVVCFGVTDQLFEEYPNGGMFNMTWAQLEKVAGGLPEHLWDKNVLKTPYHARLFSKQGSICDQITRLSAFLQRGVQMPAGIEYVSLADVALRCSPAEFHQIRHNALKVSVVSQVEAMMPYIGSIDAGASLKYLALAHRNSLEDVFECLHELMLGFKPDGEVTGTGWSWSAGRNATRLLAAAADVLSALAGWQGNIRTGPASNRFFSQAFQQLQQGSLERGIEALKKACLKLCLPASSVSCAGAAELTRAARHYQKAVELLIARQVLESVGDVSKFEGVGSRVAAGVWVEGRCPARLDLAGGWSDTPPVCYELGGAVLNVAICVNGEMPIIVRGRWNETHFCGECCLPDCEKEHKGVYCLLESGNAKYDAGIQTMNLHWTKLQDLADYNNPLSPGALIKAALVHSGIVDLSCADSLDEQLARYGGWLELQIISRLPSGSGLGGSSLIGGALLAVLANLRGKAINAPALMHATLALEQRMTTGGGWQDQVGGLYGGAKLGVSYGKLPVEVEAFSIPLSPELLELINARLLLLYTGQVRLAKNILQNVVRSWYTGNNALHDTFSNLIECALTAASALAAGNLDGLATCISKYWQLKKTVAAGSEPEKISKLFHSLSTYVSGASLAGAGGGGYLYGLLKAPSDDAPGSVCPALAEELARFGMEADRLEVSVDGLIISIKGENFTSLRQAPKLLDQRQLDKIKDTFERHWKVSKKSLAH